MNIDERLRAASRALRDSSVAQVDAASRLREIVRRNDQLVAHGPTTILPDPPGQPQEPPTPLAPSPPSSGKASAAPAGRSAAATPTSHGPTGRP